MGTHEALALEVAGWILIIASCFFVTLVHFILEPYRWNYCYQPSGSSARSHRGTRDALLCTALATYILPFKLGIPLRVVLLRRNGELTLHFIGVVIALDGLISLFTWAVVAGFGAWAAALQWRPPWYLWVVVFAGGAGLAAVLAARRKMGARLLQRFRDALVLLEHPWSRISRSTVILLADVLSYGLRHALLVLLVTGDVRDMPMGASIGIIATFTGIISGLPMGLVGYDATLVALLALVGISTEQALLIVVINRVLNLACAAVLGIPAAMRMGLGASAGSIIKKFREMANDRN